MSAGARLALVVQRCGLEVTGGSEKLCLDVARHLATHAEVSSLEILTTCALDYRSWADHYPAGPGTIAGVPAIRFRVGHERDDRSFDRLSERLRPRIGGLDRTTEEDWVRAQGPWSPALLAHLREHGREYDAVLFFTYLYATSYFGVAEVRDRAVLVPCAHDEWMIQMQVWDEFFRSPRAIAFNTPEERLFVEQRFPGLGVPAMVTGTGIDPPSHVDRDAFRRRMGIEGDYLLYVGRIDPSKGCADLIDHYAGYRKLRPDVPPLVLVGRSVMEIPEVPGLLAAGFVDEQTKWEAVAGCAALLMPSPYESLSIVLLEAWSQSRPVLVNGRCDVLVGQTRRAGGGLWYGDEREFGAALDRLLDPAVADALGRQGAAYVQESCLWEQVSRQYLDLVEIARAPR